MPAPLEGVRVIEACGPIGHYAGRLLADLGADVVKVEPPSGDPGRGHPPFLDGAPHLEGSLPFLLLNANKRGVTLDLETEAGRGRFLELIAGADVLIDDWQPHDLARLGLDGGRIEEAAPTLIRCSITGWGLSGPRADWASADIVGVAMSGVMRLAGFPGGPPEQLPDAQGYHCASITAAAGIAAAILHRDATGEGQTVEVSMQEALSMAQETAMMTWDILGTNRERTGTRAALGVDMPGLGLHEAADGHVYMMASGTAGSGFAGLLQWMTDEGAAEDLHEEPYASFIAHSMDRATVVSLLASEATRAETDARLSHVVAVVHRFIASRPKQWLYEEGQARRVLIGMVSTPEDIARSPQLAARDWWQALADPARGRTLTYPGVPWRLLGTPASLRRPAPTLGEHNTEVLGEPVRPRPVRASTGSTASTASTEGARPLDGVRVLDLTWFGAGPIATRALASLGADVIRVETAKRPDGLRVAAPRPAGATSLNVSGYYNNFNSDKRSIALDLTTPRGHELGLELVRWADVFMTNMTNRAVAKIGMDGATVSAANPSIIALYQPMQGLTGPHAEFQGFGAILSTICGVNHLAGFEVNPPAGVGSNYPDYVVNPLQGVTALIAAIRHRRRTGEGQLIDMSQLESSTAAMSGPLFATMNSEYRHARLGNRVLHAAPHGAYPLAGADEWLVIACLDEAQWRALARACGHEEWATDPRFAHLEARKAHEDELDALVGTWTAALDGLEAMERLQSAGVPAGLAQRASAVLADPHLGERGYFVYLDHAEAGRRAYDGPPFRLSRTPARLERPAPMLGEHTFEVASTVLGLRADEVAALIADGTLT
ncbi:MAG: CoA transferase [Dehalococcoidia bacterium]|nr:CoA transferase [Dehalococcoidia bacterium]